MADFKFGVTVPLPTGAIVSAALGASNAAPLTDKDLNKAVKLTADSTYELCADGDEVEGILQSVEPHTVNDGFGFGSVLRHVPGARTEALNSGATTLAIGDTVVADAQAAVGTAQNDPKVKKAAGTETNFLWRVVSLPETGVQGKVILIEAY